MHVAENSKRIPFRHRHQHDALSASTQTADDSARVTYPRRSLLFACAAAACALRRGCGTDVMRARRRLTSRVLSCHGGSFGVSVVEKKTDTSKGGYKKRNYLRRGRPSHLMRHHMLTGLLTKISCQHSCPCHYYTSDVMLEKHFSGQYEVPNRSLIMAYHYGIVFPSWQRRGRSTKVMSVHLAELWKAHIAVLVNA